MNLRNLHALALALLALAYSTPHALANRDLETGTFLTRDPAGFVDGPNVYTYVRQNPWSAFDPDGLAEFKIGAAYFMFFQDGVMGTCRMANEGDSHIPQIVSLDSGRQRLKDFKADPVKFASDVKNGYRNPDNAPDSLAGQSGRTIAYGEAVLSLGRGLKMPNVRPPAMATAHGAVIQANGTSAATVPSLPAGALLQSNQESKPEGNSARNISNANAGKTGGQRTQGTRYVGESEAAVIEQTGRVPNTNAAGETKVVYYTHDRPVNSATDAQATYNLPSKPTHRVTVDTRSANPGSAGNVEGGTGIELTTDRVLPAIGKPKKLGE